MGIYKVTAPDKSFRVVEAPTNKASVAYVVQDTYVAEALSSVQLATLIRDNPGLNIETTAPTAPEQMDIEDEANKDNGNDPL